MKARQVKTGAEETHSTRDHILDAAEKQFAERGFAGVSVREIAAEAGLKNQASLYHHFKNKRAIYEAVLARRVEPLLALLTGERKANGAPGDPGPADPVGVQALVDPMLDYLIDHPYLPRLIQRAGMDDSRQLKKTITRFLSPLYEHGLLMLENVETPWEANELPHVAAGFYHLIFGYFANAELLGAVLQHDLKSSTAVARQRKFLKAAARRLLGIALEPAVESS